MGPMLGSLPMDMARVAGRRDSNTNDAAWMVMGNLIAGMVFYGGLGWLLGRWFGNQSVLTAVGFVFGLAAGTYLVFVRLGSAGRPVPSQASSEIDVVDGAPNRGAEKCAEVTGA